MSFVKVEYPRNSVCLITLNRPERMNAMAFDVMVPFKEALEEVSFNNDVRVVVVTGAGCHEIKVGFDGFAVEFVVVVATHDLVGQIRALNLI